MLDPIALDPAWSGRRYPAGREPRRGQVALLTQVGAENPYLEVLPLDASEPALQRPDGRVDGDRLPVVGWCARPDRSCIASVLPEERPHTRPVPPRKAPGIATEQVLDDVLIATGTGGSMVFDAAPGDSQEADPKRRELWAAQADRRCASRWARSSSFSRRVPGVSSAKAHCTMPPESISTYARLEKNLSSSSVP